MKKNLSRILALSLVLVMCMMLAAPVMALETSNNASATVPVEKTLKMNKDAVPVEAEFAFTLAADTAVPESGKLETNSTNSYMVYQGIIAGVKYTATTPTTATDVSGSNGSVTVKFHGTSGTTTDTYTADEATGTKSLKKCFDIDFSEVAFPEPGVYRYLFTENGNVSGYTTDSTTYYIDVYVQYADNGSAANRTIAQIIITDNDGDHTQGSIGGGSVENKDTKIEFENEKETYNLTLKKTVSGNQGSRSDYFDFTLSFGSTFSGTYTYTGPGETDTGTIVITNGTVTSVTGNAASNTMGKIKLKHDETIVIKDLPAGTTWTIVEDDYSTSDGYSTTVTTSGTGAAQGDNTRTAQNTTGMSDANSATYTNTRTGTIPTGILLTIAPFAALMAIGLIGAVVVLGKKRAA